MSKSGRDENGDLNCTGEVESMSKCVYRMENRDSVATVYRAKTLQIKIVAKSFKSNQIPIHSFLKPEMFSLFNIAS